MHMKMTIGAAAVLVPAVMGRPAMSNQDAASFLEGRNRLGETASPYLLQHAQNPVHWWPWGDGAFEAARKQGKPIFLSIGYSTCYWCHVMERESFENQEVADYLNEHFIPIKVDREERPDVDEIYMTATQLLNQGRGGWPMSVFLEPGGLKPFFAGTYFPREDRGTRRGFMSIMEFMHDSWESNNEAVLKQADAVASAVVQRLSATPTPEPVNSTTVEQGISQLLAKYDRVNGGFATAPKFPMPITINFLMEAGWDIPQVRNAVTYTLDRMFMGGMYDQVAGGFHRYSTDAKWLVPHFEKMLYDNGQLASTYARAYELTGDEAYAAIVRETLDYVLREMVDSGGAFHSAQDAETNHLEGGTYLWRPDDVAAVLTEAGQADDVAFATEVYGLGSGTNFRDPHAPDEPPSNVLYLVDKPDALAAEHDMDEPAFRARLDAIDAALLSARDLREQPLTDDKIIASWNGLMIGGFADGGRVLGNQVWIDAAETAMRFLLTAMRQEDGTLLRTWRDGREGGGGFLEDYAAVIHGLLRLHAATDDAMWLQEAISLYHIARERFFVEGRGWYDTQEGQDDLFVRSRSIFDGSVPAATSMILADLVGLEEATGEAAYLEDALSTIAAISPMLASSPVGAALATSSLHRVIQRHPDRFDEPFEISMDNPSPVRMSVDPGEVMLTPGGTATVAIRFRMARGWHVNTNDPGDEYAVPLAIVAVGGGVTAEPSFPAGRTMSVAGESVRVFGDSVVIPVTLRADANASGSVKLLVTWQACTEQECQMPETTEAPCTITVR